MCNRFFYLTLLLITTSCAPAIYRIQPVGEGAELFMGLSYVRTVDRGVEVVVGCDGRQAGRVVFDVKVTNHGDKPVTVDPGNFVYATHQETVADASRDFDSITFAINPERELIKMDKAIADEEHNYQVQSCFNTVGCLLDFTSEVMVIAGKDETEEERAEREACREERDADWEETQVEHKERMERLQSQKILWQNLALRLTTLHPGESVRNKVYFPQPTGETYLTVSFPVGISDHEFLFRQFKVN